MSFTSVGEFYEVAPRGVGEFYEVSPTGSLGAYYDIAGFGAAGSSFSADAVWADAQLGGSCYLPEVQTLTAEMEGRCNAAGGRATRTLQGALNKLGYGPLDVDGQYGPITGAAWKRFAADNGVPSGPGLMNYAGLKKMEEKLASNVSKAGFAMWAVGLLVFAGGLYLATRPKKKKSSYKGPYKMNSGAEIESAEKALNSAMARRKEHEVMLGALLADEPNVSQRKVQRFWERRQVLLDREKWRKHALDRAVRRNAWRKKETYEFEPERPLTHGELIARGKRRAKSKRRRSELLKARVASARAFRKSR